MSFTYIVVNFVILVVTVVQSADRSTPISRAECGVFNLRTVTRVPFEVTTSYYVRIRDKYPFEEHHVTTGDGYILTLHRIPYPPGSSKEKNRPAVLVLHGLECSSTDWVVNGPGKSLAYILSDAGYDVWLPNTRGNFYSRNHTRLNPDFEIFWDYEWHQIGMYDLPAIIKKVQEITGRQKLHYIGHSQGGTIYLVLASLQPKFTAESIHSAHLMTPGCFMGRTSSPLARLVAPFLGLPNWSLRLEMIRATQLNCIASHNFCSGTSFVSDMCANMVGFVCGDNPGNYNKTASKQVLATFPAGSSMKQFLHFIQMMQSGKFRQFDYGREHNFRVYQRSTPPDYPLANIKVNTFFYGGTKDKLVDYRDVRKCSSQLERRYVPRKPHIVKYNHVDFMWGINSNLLYREILKDML